MKKLFILLLVFAINIEISAADLSSFYSKSDAFFKKYITNGKVDYKTIKANSSEITFLYQEINKMNLTNASEDEKKAFYMNAYNLIVIYQVSKYYPLKSPLDQSGFFDKVKHNVAGESMTLNSLEIKKLILTYKDPRIHFALACAAVSCPPLASFAFKPATMDAALTTRTKKALNDKDWLKVNASSKKVELSKIFEWYKKDFTMNGAKSIIDFINQYRTTPIPENYKVAHYEYDWALNES